MGRGASGRLLSAAATTVAATVAPARAAALLPVAGAAAGLGRRCCATARASRGGASGAGAAPARTGTTRTGRCEEGGVGNALLVVRQPCLLEDEHVVGVGEHRKNGGVGGVVDGAGEVRVEPSEHGEDERTALDGVADSAEFSSLQLDALTVLRDGGVALLEGVEHLKKEDGASLLVGSEDLLDGDPKLPGGLIITGEGEIKDGVADGAEEPTLDTRVGDDPLWIVGEGGAGASICGRRLNLPHNTLK